MKKRILKLFLYSTVAFTAISCDNFLDINSVNPNQATESTPQQVLPNALTVTAASMVTYNDYGSWHVGYVANAGGYGGWGEQLTYNYTTSTYNQGASMWATTYDNLTDYHYIERSSQNDPNLAYYNAIAKIMKAYNFQLLVDTYGDIPYTEALRGVDVLTPKYDNAEEIYQNLLIKLDSANILISNATDNVLAVGNSDIMFAGDMTRWTRFANSIKLRLLVRASKTPGAAVPAWVTAGFTSFGANPAFLQQDAIVNPGYAATSGKQNPYWERYHSNATGTVAGNGRSRIPTIFALTFYRGPKINDPARGAATYRTFPNTPVNQLGEEGTAVPTAPSGAPAWYIGTGTGISASNTHGILKGRTMGTPIMLAAEANLLLAEAYTRGLLTGDAKAAFNMGIENSFRYLYKGVNNEVVAGKNPVTDAAAYITANAGNYLADFDAATTVAQKVEAIITQKYVALNFIHGHEAWNEYRRTGYPTVTGTAAATTFASQTSTLAARADRLPVRILYPASEYQVNSLNAPASVDVSTSRIFWDAQ